MSTYRVIWVAIYHMSYLGVLCTPIYDMSDLSTYTLIYTPI